MKKTITFMSLVLGLTLANAQQTTPVKSTTVAPAKVEKMNTVKKQDVANSTVIEVKPAPTSSAVKLKKDGTPDKRFKANQRLKKDGTPDRRYKTK